MVIFYDAFGISGQWREGRAAPDIIMEKIIQTFLAVRIPPTRHSKLCNLQDELTFLRFYWKYWYFLNLSLPTSLEMAPESSIGNDPGPAIAYVLW